MESTRYTSTNIWRSGWTSQTAHFIVGTASNHGNARYTMMKALCGKNLNPGHGWLDASEISAPYIVCQACLSGQVAKSAKTQQPVAEYKQCADGDCEYGPRGGKGRASKTSDYCSVCRPYHEQ